MRNQKGISQTFHASGIARLPLSPEVSVALIRNSQLVAQRPSGTLGQALPLRPGQHAYSGAFLSLRPQANVTDYPLPLSGNTGSLQISDVKPVNTRSVNIAQPIAKGTACEPSRGLLQGLDPRGDPWPCYRPPPMLRRFGDTCDPYHDERREEICSGNEGPYVKDQAFSPQHAGQGKDAYSQPPGGQCCASGHRSPSGRRGGRIGEDSETISVGSPLVESITERQRKNIRRIESDAEARVRSSHRPDASGSVRVCRISGGKSAGREAKTEISRIISENGAVQLRTCDGALGRSFCGPIESVTRPPFRELRSGMHIMVPDHAVGHIIGRGGKTIKDLQERSGCHISILSETENVNGFRPVSLAGTANAITSAKNFILELVESRTRQPASLPQRGLSIGGSVRDLGAGPTDSVIDTLLVPCQALGIIIGKGGETIREMARMTGCKLKVQPPSGRHVEREIGLVGSRCCVEEAKRRLMDKVNNMEHRDRLRRARHDKPSQEPQHQSSADVIL